MQKDDVIYRQEAIDGADAIIARDTSGNNDVVKAMTAWKEYIKGLPSAQPEPAQVARDIATIIENEKDMRVIAEQPIRCKDCRYVVKGQDAYTKDYFYNCNLWQADTVPDGFCHEAEEVKEEGEVDDKRKGNH